MCPDCGAAMRVLPSPKHYPTPRVHTAEGRGEPHSPSRQEIMLSSRLNAEFTADNMLPIPLQKSQGKHSSFSTSSTLFLNDAGWQWISAKNTDTVERNTTSTELHSYCLALDSNPALKSGFLSLPLQNLGILAWTDSHRSQNPGPAFAEESLSGRGFGSVRIQVHCWYEVFQPSDLFVINTACNITFYSARGGVTF